MPTKEDRRLAAATLGMDPERMDWLEERLMPLGAASAVHIDKPINVYPDKDDKQMWEVEVTGSLATETGGMALVVEFRFRMVVNDLELWRGSSYTPDHYRITMAGEVVFEGDVENPETPGDGPGWARYDVFSPIRATAWDAATSLLATGRRKPNIIGPLKLA